jgi:hypothetical protein
LSLRDLQLADLKLINYRVLVNPLEPDCLDLAALVTDAG